MKMKQYNTNHFESWWNPLYIYSSSIWGKKRFVKTFSYYTIQLPQVEPKKKDKTRFFMHVLVFAMHSLLYSVEEIRK